MQLADLIPAVGTRSIVIGKTGEGKSVLLTFLTSQLIPLHNFTIIIDPKGEFNANGTVVESISEINDAKATCIIYRPNIDTDIVSEVDSLLRGVYHTGNTLLVFDELYGIQENNNYPNALNPIYTRGRSRKITVLAACQRPRFVPRYCISECENHYIFRTMLEDDRKYLASIVGNEVIVKPERYNFYFSSIDKDITPTIAKLNLQI